MLLFMKILAPCVVKSKRKKIIYWEYTSMSWNSVPWFALQTYFSKSVSVNPLSISVHCWWYSRRASLKVANWATCSICKRTMWKSWSADMLNDDDLHRSPANWTCPSAPDEGSPRTSPRPDESRRLKRENLFANGCPANGIKKVALLGLLVS